VLLAAGAHGKRFAVPNARILIHQPSGSGEGQSSDIEIQAREIMRMNSLLEKMLSDHTGQSIEGVRNDIKRDKILTAEEAVTYGLIDEVIQSRKTSKVGTSA
jgi:ATP-dependent Clp protease protease subunit